MTPGEEAILSVRGVSAAYGASTHGARPVLHDVTLTLARGQTLGLVGESGSGKTTLSRVVLGLITPLAGEVRVFGRDIATLDAPSRKAMRRQVQMVFQDPYSSLNPYMSVRDTIAEPLRVHTFGDRAQRTERVDELLAQVGLDRSLGRRYPAQLSGGQRQRVAIARALALKPALLICDEPVSALDVSVQAQILNLLKRLQHELALAMLFISHDLSVIRFTANRIAVIQKGRIVEIGTKDQIFKAPSHPYTRELLAASMARTRRSA